MSVVLCFLYFSNPLKKALFQNGQPHDKYILIDAKLADINLTLHGYLPAFLHCFVHQSHVELFHLLQ